MLFLRLRLALALPTGAPTPASEERARRGLPSGARGPVAVASTTRNFRCASNFTRINSLVAGGGARRGALPAKAWGGETKGFRVAYEAPSGGGDAGTGGSIREDEEAGPGSFRV